MMKSLPRTLATRPSINVKSYVDLHETILTLTRPSRNLQVEIIVDDPAVFTTPLSRRIADGQSGPDGASNQSDAMKINLPGQLCFAR